MYHINIISKFLQLFYYLFSNCQKSIVIKFCHRLITWYKYINPDLKFRTSLNKVISLKSPAHFSLIVYSASLFTPDFPISRTCFPLNFWSALQPIKNPYIHSISNTYHVYPSSHLSSPHHFKESESPANRSTTTKHHYPSTSRCRQCPEFVPLLFNPS